MTQRFLYDDMTHYSPPAPYDYYFKEKVENGWRLVCVTKVSKDNFTSYWEKPADD